MRYELKDLEEKYELELDRVVREIGDKNVKSVLLQLPDGLKPYGLVICDYVSKRCSCDVRLWLGDCFGACDLPDSDVDLVVQFGHAKW